MKKAQALKLLANSKTLLQEKYGVTKIALFGFTKNDIIWSIITDEIPELLIALQNLKQQHSI